MVEVSAKSQAADWANALQTGKEPSISYLSELNFGLSALEVVLNKLGDGLYEEKLNLNMKKETCLKLLTDSLLQNGIGSLEDLEATHVELVSDIYKATSHG